MRHRLSFVAVPLLAGAAFAQDPFALGRMAPFELVAPDTVRTTPMRAAADRAVVVHPAALSLPFGATTVPELGGDHPIAPPVPPGMVGRDSRSGGSGDTPPAPTTSGGPANPAPSAPSGPSAGSAAPGAGHAPTGPRTAGRGTPLEALETTTWSHWWAWNRGVFELPALREVRPASTGNTVVGVDPRPRAALVELCRSPSIPVRVAAVQALGRVGAPVDELLPFLEDSAREVRLTALLAIGSGGTASHAHALASWLARAQQGEAVVAALAGFALLREGPARNALVSSAASLLGDERSEVQAAAALATTVLDTAAARAAARKLLGKASTAADRAFAAQVLGRDADDADVALLIDLAATRSIDVRRSAAMALGRTHHGNALPALCDALDKERDLGTRACLLMALGDHRGDGAETVLLRELGSGAKALRGFAALGIGVWGRGREANDPLARAVVKALLAERNRDQKGAYLLALGLLRHEGSRTLLADHLSPEEESSTRGAAATALGLLGGEASLAPLAKTLANDSCPWARQQAARAMAACGTKAIDALVAALQTEKNGHVRAGALWALGSFDHVRATAALLACAADASEQVDARAASALALGRAFRKHEPRMPELRFQHDDLLSPPIVGWAFGQEL